MHCQNIAILADTAAQRSLITKEAADRLKLPIISEERASILGYGQVKATNQVYKVVEITLGPPKGSDNKKTCNYKCTCRRGNESNIYDRD